MTERILVIRLGALGDILLCMQAFQDIRAAWPNACLTLQTMPAFAGLGRAMPWFDAVVEDPRPSFLQLSQWWKLGAALRGGNFTRVIDFQNKPRTWIYCKLFLSKAEWHGDATPREERIHHQVKILRQTRAMGIKDSGPLKLDWLSAPVDGLNLPPAYAVLIPGCAPHRPEKRWPSSHFAALARELKAKGLTPVLVGTKADTQVIAEIKQDAEFAFDLCGKTGFPQLASLFRGARLAVGNDTGPTHLAAILGTPTLSLFSNASDPARSGPMGARVAWLQREKLDDLAVEEVIEALSRLTFG
ncbi:MAG: glycosyltransferase family 9 protein [Proteobacteria bacterium]|nr:glycosyltransferase family 9 protein [Pseudomonadota bacterium]